MPVAGVTCSCRIRDGGGAQAQRIISVIALARARGYHYCHTPMVRAAHADGEGLDDDDPGASFARRCRLVHAKEIPGEWKSRRGSDAVVSER